MGNKLTAFCGSPRKSGLTNTLLHQIIIGAKSEGMKTVFYDLNMRGIRGCQHCGYCRNHEGCSIKDDPLSSMYSDLAETSAILFGSPIYFYHISGQSKIWLDRLLPMIDRPGFQSRYPGKKAATVFAQGFDDRTLYQSVIQEMNDRFDRWGWKVMDTFLITESQGITQDLLDRAYIAGKKLATESR